MWLDAVPYAPSLRLDDQSFQDAGRVRMGVRTISSFGTCWTCPCGHTVEGDDVAHAIGCNRLSGLVQSRHDETAEVLREFVGRLGFSSSREGRYSRLAPRTPNRAQARWDFHYNLRPGPGHVLADVSFIHPLAASYIRSAARTPGHAAALRDADKRRDYFADHNCPGDAFRAISFETLGRFSPGAMQFLCEATHAAFPQPGHQRAVFFANEYRQLSVVQCRYLSRMLTAAAGLHTARTGSGWIRGAPLPSPEVTH
jgi:hypothetical protein